MNIYLFKTSKNMEKETIDFAVYLTGHDKETIEQM